MKRKTIQDIQSFKNSKAPFAMLTAYDYSSARLVDDAGIPLILVGDSAAMVMLGYDTTLPITMLEMMVFVKAVVRGSRGSMVIADMPFMSYQSSVQLALENAGKFLKECGAQAVKLEGGGRVLNQITAMVKAGIPVMGHIGLTPQSFHQLSGFKIQGNDSKSAQHLIESALSIEDAGAFSIVLEGIPDNLAKIITKKLNIPTIGIGAGKYCDGQIQVFHDILGLDGSFNPRHARKYINLHTEIIDAILKYKNDVESGKFPAQEHSIQLKDDLLKSFS